MYKINCLNPIAKVGTKLLTDNYTMTDNFAEADAALVRSASVHELELPDSLEAIARAGAGVNNIPLDKCAQKGIVVFNTPGANANGVKELVIAGMLMASRDLVGGVKWVEANKDDENIVKDVEKAKKAFAGGEIKGKKLGVIGLGAIGVQVANTAINLGMDVYGYDPYISVDAAWKLSRHIIHIESLDAICENCDFITIHVPALPSTKGMISEDALSKMKDGVVVLNFARDVLVDEDAMCRALESGKVKKYVTDFPNPKSVHMKNVLVLPHLGASTEESEDNCAVMAVQELMDYLENGNIKNSVNYPACDLGDRSGTRLAIFNRNVPNMIGQFASTLAEAGINIPSMTNQSKGDLAYTLMDVEGDVTDAVLDKLMAIQGVFKIRVIK
ncbi:phosphoglycerate dehydrogenase [Lachnotalea sp. AF33-28]|jgi:D-3-phosphoglycerate dehydrogenase|uniref:phosphoglycerate dehydrogenase n=1 Tax=Lachnotalea sp. AF33-28 TaxID=2292046 RepID=UPI000E508296|nr:phosphoglycerate dehydrogenase [Lachnotalea sp. AF33-28]RHP35042.1 3-phosphoglycerate dehydrogenase [Lachnotalea sp. AF33-28]